MGVRRGVSGLRIIVCGGRDYRDAAAVDRALSALDERKGIAFIVQGAADGADRLAAEWGWAHGKKVGSFSADWQTHGKRAGPIRNQEMIDAGADGVVAFPGKCGTADLVRRAVDAGMPVWRPYG